MLRRGENNGAMPPGLEVVTPDGVEAAMQEGGAAVVVNVPLYDIRWVVVGPADNELDFSGIVRAASMVAVSTQNRRNYS